MLMHFDPDTRVFVLGNWHKIQRCDKFSSVILICLTPFSQFKFGLIGYMILMKECVSLKAAAIKIGKIFTVIIAMVAKGKNASLVNSMLNHPGHVTLTLYFFKISTSGRYHRDLNIPKILASNSKRFRFYVIFKRWQIDDRGKPWPNNTFS